MRIRKILYVRLRNRLVAEKFALFRWREKRKIVFLAPAANRTIIVFPHRDYEKNSPRRAL